MNEALLALWDPVTRGLLRLALGALLLGAALHKLRAPARFRAVLADYRLLPAGAVPVAAGALVACEVAVGLALLVPGSGAAPALGAALLLAGYGLAMAVNLARGRREIDCGCGGPGRHRPISSGLVARNALLAGAALLAAAPAPGRALLWPDAVTLLGGLAALALLHAAAERALAGAPWAGAPWAERER